MPVVAGTVAVSDLHTISNVGGRKHLADVIFVHGLGGDPFATWSHDPRQPSDCWPYWLVDEFPGVAVHTLQYPASWTNWFGGEAMPLFDRAKNVLNLLTGKGVGTRPIMFVCHSLGGLLVKQILREGADSADVRWAAIAERTRAIVFVATPHGGAGLAGVAKRLGLALRTSPVMADLKAHTASLRGLSESFRRQVQRSNVRILCYYEAYKTRAWRLRFLPLGIKVVEPGDADPGLADVTPVPLDGDHFQICKPKARDRAVCVDVAGLLREVLAEAESSPGVSSLTEHRMLPQARRALTRIDAVTADTDYLAPQEPNTVASDVNEALERLGRIDAALVGRGLPEAIDRDLARRLSLAERRAGFPEMSQANPFSALGREAMQAGSGTGAVRRRVLLRATRVAAIRGELVEAEAFYAAAEVVPGPADETPARAHLLETRGQVDEAIRLLRDRKDPDSLSALMGIQRRAKGDGWVLEREELGMFLPDRLTSNGLIDLAQTLTKAGRHERVEALLAGASEEQLEACPVLLLLRALNQLALTLPAPDRHLIKDGLPLIVAQLRAAAAGDELRRRLDDGLQDLMGLMAHLVDLELPATRSQVREIVRLFQLMHPERQAKALSELRMLLDQPGQALERLSFAFAFLPGFDPTPIGHYLATREELGGLDDNELQAAFVIALHSDQPRSLVEFIAKHRVRLERAIGSAEVASLEVQALAAANDPASARLVFDHHVEEFEDTLKGLLLTQIAKAEGEDPVMAHKRLYEETRALTALRSLVGILAARGDSAALAHYGALLYEETRSLEGCGDGCARDGSGGDGRRLLRLRGAQPRDHRA
jgi:hypothetical protein